MKRLWAIGFAMLVLGFLLTTQYRVTQAVNAPKPADLRAEELSRELTATKNKLQALERSNADLKAEVDQLAKAGGGTTVAVPMRDVNRELWAGTVPAKGKGVIVTVSATGRNVEIQDDHLLLITHELWGSRAEGISINGQRLTTISEIRQIDPSGNQMMINGTLTGTPYEVAAIGNPQELEGALKAAGGVVSRLARLGIRVQVFRSEQVLLPSYGSPPLFQYLLPL